MGTPKGDPIAQLTRKAKAPHTGFERIVANVLHVMANYYIKERSYGTKVFWYLFQCLLVVDLR